EADGRKTGCWSREYWSVASETPHSLTPSLIPQSLAGGIMKSRAAVAWEASKPLSIEKVEVEGPKHGEVLLQVKATGVCHTDAYTLSGKDPEGIFPAIMGHEGGAIVKGSR